MGNIIIFNGLNGPITDLIWDQAKMKVGDGGLGLRSATDHSIAVFTASVCNTWELVAALMGVTVAGEGEEAAVEDAVEAAGEAAEAAAGVKLGFRLHSSASCCPPGRAFASSGKRAAV